MRAQYKPLEPGNPETDYFYYNTPAEFHTLKAFTLFDAAERAGFLCWKTTNQAAVDFLNEDPDLALRRNQAGPLRTNTHLAYWCALASYYLGMDRKSTTFWRPFEDLFGLDPKTLSRATGPLDLDRNAEGRPIGRAEYAAEIDAFFDEFETSTQTTTL